MSRTTARRFPGAPTLPRIGFLRAGFALAFAAVLAGPAEGQKITEVVFDHKDEDTHVGDTLEYIEVYAGPGADLLAYTLVELDGSPGGDPGKILHVFTPTTANGAGFWSTGFKTSTLERPAFTILLVSGFTGLEGQDLDGGNDGILDPGAPWTTVLDGVAFSDGSAGALAYAGAPVLGPGFDGNATPPGGASRFPYWRDTDSVADWKRNDFDGDGLPGFTGSLAPGEARNTPGSVTRVTVADYWAAVDPSTPEALRTTVHAAIENHIRFPYFADTTDTWDILESADEAPGNPSSILDVYKNEVYTKAGGGNSFYNREHSWPKSYGFPDEPSPPHTDCHHLFLSNIGYNSNRDNTPFGTCGAGCTPDTTVANYGFGGAGGPYPGDSNWWSGKSTSDVYEVWNHRRGDIARAQLYMDVRYESGSHAVTGFAEPDLILTDNTALIQGFSSNTSGPAYMGRLSVLLEWHLEDPVDDGERRRNDVVESFQGNRNPFVDHPEWVACVFSATCGGNPSISFSGLKTATDSSLCSVSGVDLAWNAPSAWNDDCDSGCDRGFRVLRNGSPISTGGCASPLSATATSCSDATGVPGVTYAYAVEAFNHEGETSTGNGPKSAVDRTDDDLAPVFASGPSASSAVPTSFTVTWTTDEPSDSRLEYGTTASYDSTISDAALVTVHSITVTGLAPSTEYHFRAGSTDACDNGPAWSPDGTVTTAAVSATLDIGGYQLTQTNTEKSYTLPPGTAVPAGGYVVIGRNVSKAAFEAFWGVTLGPNVVYLNANNTSGNLAPTINGDETFTVKDAVGTILDGPTIAMPPDPANQSIRRNDPCLAAGLEESWTRSAATPTLATPGTGAGPGCGTGLVINEFSDASSGNSNYEFVELHWDAPVAAPAATTSAATDVTTTGATLNGTVNPNGVSTTVSFEWGTTTSYDQTTAGQAFGPGTTPQPVSAALTDLAPCTTYHYRVKATSVGGTATGEDAELRTSCPGADYYLLTPCRVVNTRRADYPAGLGSPSIGPAGSADRTLPLAAGACGVPTDARAVTLNITVADATGPGYVTVYPGGTTAPATSTLNFALAPKANNAIVPVATDGTASIAVKSGGTSSFNLLVDVTGFFR